MEELKSVKIAPESAELVEERKKNYPVPDGFNPIGVTVFADLKAGGVVLGVNNMAAVRLSVQGARDLALLLRQKANLVEKRG